jgi:hypothetical protein
MTDKNPSSVRTTPGLSNTRPCSTNTPDSCAIDVGYILDVVSDKLFVVIGLSLVVTLAPWAMILVLFQVKFGSAHKNVPDRSPYGYFIIGSFLSYVITGYYWLIVGEDLGTAMISTSWAGFVVLAVSLMINFLITIVLIISSIKRALSS